MARGPLHARDNAAAKAVPAEPLAFHSHDLRIEQALADGVAAFRQHQHALGQHQPGVVFQDQTALFIAQQIAVGAGGGLVDLAGKKHPVRQPVGLEPLAAQRDILPDEDKPEV